MFTIFLPFLHKIKHNRLIWNESNVYTYLSTLCTLNSARESKKFFATTTSSHCLVCPVSLFTLTQQYSSLNKLPLAFFITPRRSWFTPLHLPLLISILALCGDIHINPGSPAPSSFSLCTYNIRSILANDHISALNDLIATHHPKIIALTETWINKSSTPLWTS